MRERGRERGKRAMVTCSSPVRRHPSETLRCKYRAAACLEFDHSDVSRLRSRYGIRLRAKRTSRYPSAFHSETVLELGLPRADRQLPGRASPLRTPWSTYVRRRLVQYVPHPCSGLRWMGAPSITPASSCLHPSDAQEHLESFWYAR